ncbi:uncharacterized protein LOC109831138 [Asparagus officinalis]|uniref:uncharacterized protein LOC109831138 n=1 Tax=Asparagus officinalis TaxID=4686 RepID=UPI00098E1AFC|nr:uncharacterized protein LOC109831138 [Asparagus officinalis]
MAKKKGKNRKKILEIGLRSSNSSFSPSEDHADAGFDEDDEGSTSDLMGSTGPKGEKKKVLMADLLNSDPLSSQQAASTDNLPQRHQFLNSACNSVKNLDYSVISARNQDCLTPQVIVGSRASLGSRSGTGGSGKVSWADEVEFARDQLNLNPASSLDANIQSNLISLLDDSSVPIKNNFKNLNDKNESLKDAGNLDSSDKNDINNEGNLVIDSGNVKKSWISLFADNRKTGCGLNLNFVKPENNDFVSFSEEEWNEGLRLNLWSSKAISKIASHVGKPVATDKLTASKQRLAYARVLVEVHMPSSLPDSIPIHGPNGQVYNQKVIYEFKPKWCDSCKIVGHDTNFCKKHPKIQKRVPKTSAGISDKFIHTHNQHEDQIQKSPCKLVHAVHVKAQSANVAGSLPKLSEGDENLKSNQISKSSSKSVHDVHVQAQTANVAVEDTSLPGELELEGFSSRDNVQAFSAGKIKGLADSSKYPSGSKAVQAVHVQEFGFVGSNKGKSLQSSKTWSVVMGELRQIQHRVGNKPWILSGDFNAISDDEDKLGGAMVTVAETLDIREFIDDCQLTHLKTEGCFFTWNNKQEANSRVWSRLDRTLVNDAWINLYNSSHVEYLLPNCSDHSPALVSIYDECVQGKKPFKFFNMWSKHDDYLPTVTSIWQGKIPGCIMFSVTSKLKLLKIALKDLNKKKFHNISEQVIRARINLQNAQKYLQSDHLNADLIEQEKKYMLTYNKLLECEISFYQQKSRIQWCTQGDRSSSFFHSAVKAKRHLNRVNVLYDSAGNRITDGDLIIQELLEYYKQLLGSSTILVKSGSNVIHSGPCLNDAQINFLSSAVTRDEIRHAVFSMDDRKAPGPDGFGISFYKSAWCIIGDEVSEAILEFFKTGKILGMINSTAITLIPKVKCPKTPSDFRPIACCNSLYTIISKILANRIKSVMGYLINDSQSAFVKGRQISSNILLANEIVKNYNRKHISPRIMLSIDIKKAFDTVNWDFLNEMLKGLGFPVNFINWIMVCISTPKFSLSLNGTLHGYFKGKRGLRQCDPISPYLFNLGMEFLSRRLDLLKENRSFKYHPGCGKLKISHLMFVDDLLLFSKGDSHSVELLLNCFKDFCTVSGLEANPDKCKVFYGGVDDSTKGSVNRLLNFNEGVFPIKYLGVPLISKRISFND